MNPKRAEKRYNRQMIGTFLRGSRLLFLLSMLASALAALAGKAVRFDSWVPVSDMEQAVSDFLS